MNTHKDLRKTNEDTLNSEEHRQKLSESKKRISRFTQDDYDKMVQLRSEGLDYKSIGTLFDAHGSVISKILKREATSNMR